MRAWDRPKKFSSRSPVTHLICPKFYAFTCYDWTGQQSSSGISDLAPSIYCITIGSETTFLSALCVIRSPSYFLGSRTFLLSVGLTDLGHFGRYFGQNKEIVSVFNGSVVCFDVGIGLTFLGRSCITRVLVKNFTSSYFLKVFWPLDVVEILWEIKKNGVF
jgi:hypothetical protein